MATIFPIVDVVYVKYTNQRYRSSSNIAWLNTGSPPYGVVPYMIRSSIIQQYTRVTYTKVSEDMQLSRHKSAITKQWLP